MRSTGCAVAGCSSVIGVRESHFEASATRGRFGGGVIVPSGVDATTGETPGVHVSADRTLTLALPKTGLVGPPVGELWLADIGIPAEVYRRLGIPVSSRIFDSGFLVRLRS